MVIYNKMILTRKSEIQYTLFMADFTEGFQAKSPIFCYNEFSLLKTLDFRASKTYHWNHRPLFRVQHCREF